MSLRDVLRGKKLYKAQEAELDMTPMVDVTFQLLIFFMLTASFVRQRSLPVPKPKDENAAATKTVVEMQESDDTVTVRIDEHGTYYVSAPNMDDEVEVPSRNELFAKLRQARMPDAAGHIPNRLLVLAHGDAEHGRVVSAIDAGNESGMESVQVVTKDDEGKK